MYDIIIIGAGPAGLTSALYARRAEKKVLILEAKAYGGQIINTPNIENYPGIENISGFDYATNLYNQVKNLNAEIKYEKVIKIDNNCIITKNNKYQTKKIIIATGVENKKLNLKNEDKLIGKGISYCATCDGNLYKNKIVAVVGGGNTALEDAIYLSNICKEVYLIHRRDSFRADTKSINETRKINNIKLVLNSNITKINGEEKIENIEIINNDDKKSKIDIDGLFIAIGQTPNNDIFKDIIELDENGYVISKDGVHTNNKNIYVAGDTRQKDLRQLTTAVSDGAIAATTAIKEMDN